LAESRDCGLRTSGVVTQDFGRGKYFEFKRATVFGLRHLLSKHKNTIYARKLGRMATPLATPALDPSILGGLIYKVSSTI